MSASIVRVASPLLAAHLLLACGPSPGGDGLTDGEGSSSSTTGASTDATTGGPGAGAWSLDVEGCGGAFGAVLLADGDVIVAGERAPDATAEEHPWVARYSAEGDEVWSLELPELAADGGFVALDRVGEGEVIAVGYRVEAGEVRPLLARVDVAAGAIVWTRTDEPPGASALYGAAWSNEQGKLWATGVRDGDLLVASYDGGGTLLDAFLGPTGGFAPAVGFAAALAGPDLVVCGRAPASEGGRLWLGRFGPDGAEKWSVTGPDPGVGAFSDCWDMAVGPSMNIGTVEAGYTGARVAVHLPDGALVWEHGEPNAGAQAIEGGASGDFWVAGWSAARSHGEGDRHGWVRRYGPTGVQLQHVWIGQTHVSPRDLELHPQGGAVVVGERLEPGMCARAWIARVELE